MHLRPLNDRVLIKTIPPAKMVGMIHVPDSAQKTNAAEGVVIAVGPGRLRQDGTRDPMSVSDGDRVFFEPVPMSEVSQMKTAEGERVVSIGDDDVLAVIEP